jgi:hypothetical protein
VRINAFLHLFNALTGLEIDTEAGHLGFRCAPLLMSRGGKL